MSIAHFFQPVIMSLPYRVNDGPVLPRWPNSATEEAEA